MFLGNALTTAFPTKAPKPDIIPVANNSAPSLAISDVSVSKEIKPFNLSINNCNSQRASIYSQYF